MGASMADRPRTSIWRRSFGCGGCLVAIALGFVGLTVVMALIRMGDPGGPPTGPAPAGRPSVTPEETAVVGDEGYVDVPGGDGAFFASTDDDWDKMTAAQFAGSQGNQAAATPVLMRMARAGQIHFHPNGTPVLVLKTSFTARFVEVPAGEGAGQSGWVHREFIKKGRPVRPAAEVESRPKPAVDAGFKPNPSPSVEAVQKAAEDVEADRVQSERRADERRAVGLIRIGQNLENSGKTKGALDTYRRIVKEFPDTPQAKEAAGRIAAMGGE